MEVGFVSSLINIAHVHFIERYENMFFSHPSFEMFVSGDIDSEQAAAAASLDTL